MTTDGFVLRGAQLIDGTGAPRRRTDVEVVGNRVGRIGTIDSKPGIAEVDLGGLVLAPGFIDLHTHYDAQVLWEPALSNSRTHGITTAVMGNCGFTVAPAKRAHHGAIVRMLEGVEGMSASALHAGIAWTFGTFPQYLSSLRNLPLGVNVATLVGHSTVRLDVMGDAASERAASEDECATMAQAVAAAVDAGAFGFSTSRAPSHLDGDGRPVPSRATARAEIEQLADAAAAAGARMFEAALGDDLTVADLGAMAARTGLSVTYAGILTGDQSDAEIADVLSVVDRTDGCFRPQVIPMVLTHNVSCAVPLDLMKTSGAFHEAVGLGKEGQRSLYRDAGWRGRARATTTTVGAERLPRMVVAESKVHARLIGRSLADIAATRGSTPLDTLIDLALDDDLDARFEYAAHNYDDAAVGSLMKDPRTVLGLSDAGAHADRICCSHFPTHLLGHWVRERAELGLEFAVWRLTGQPAEFLGLGDRGLVRSGYAADLVAFDPARVGPDAVERRFDLPAGADRLVAGSRGIEHVWVNGVAVRLAGRNLSGAGGVVLSSQRDGRAASRVPSARV